MTPATDGPITPATDGLQLKNRLLPLGKPVVVVAPEAAPAKQRITTQTALIALVLLGIGLRLVPMVQNRNLWIDEAMLSLNLIDRSAAQLLKPLDWNQGAPAGFLLCVKAAITLFGASEWALRLVPFLGSILGLFGFTWLVRRMLPDAAAILAVGLFAVTPYLISYAAECKQYAIDAALAIGMFAAAIGLLYGKGGTRRWAVLGGVGAIAVWFSHPVVFVLGGIGAALFCEAVTKRDRTRILACSATIGCWLVSFGVCYVLLLKQLGSSKYLLDYWAGHFMPLPPLSPSDFGWLADHFFSFFAYPGGLSGGTEIRMGGLAAALFLIGIAAFCRERWTIAVALVLPALLALFASGLNKYPFAGRLLLFLVPLMLVGVARGAWVVISALRQSQPFAAYVVLGVLLFAPLLETYQQIRRPLREEQLTPLLTELRKHLQPGDKVYMYYGGVPAFKFYTHDNPYPADVILGNEYRDCRTAYRDELRQLAGEPRVWVVFSHRHQAEESLLRAYAEGLGECQEELRKPGTTAFRYDFSKRK
jgi:4-amino-4-deoxy-L-arabinose transferase-like glycosyltransferase